MIIILRTIILYAVVVATLRFMGKKQIGQLEPSELAIAIMISELASLPLAGTDIPLLNGIIPVLILAVCEIVVSAVILKRKSLRKIITGHPTIIVKNGKIMEEALKSLRYTTDDLLVEMRLKGIPRFSDIQYGILETNGQVSFILFEKALPPAAENMNIEITEKELSFPVICGGIINKEYLSVIERDELWLEKELKKSGINKDRLLLLMANRKGIEFYQLKGGGKSK